MFKAKDNGSEAKVNHARRFVKALGLDGGLSDKLLVRQDGQPYQPIQLTAIQLGAPGQPGVIEQYQLLGRRTAVGGCERLVESNRKRFAKQQMSKLEEFLSSHDVAVGQVLAQLTREVEQIKVAHETLLAKLKAEFEDCDSRLGEWQATQSSEPNVVDTVFKFLGFAAMSRMTQTDAVKLWNQREELHKQVVAAGASLSLVQGLAGAVNKMQRHLTEVVELASGALAETQREAKRLPTTFEAGAFSLDSAVLAEALSDEVNPSLLARLLAAVRAGGAEALMAESESIAQSEAVASLESLDVFGFIELEGRQMSLAESEGLDPVITVAEELLDQVQRQFPTWQLVEGSRPRVETLQILPANVQGFEGLTRAYYPDELDRLGFVQVQLEVALDDLRMVRARKEDFEQARQSREYFVLEEMIEANPRVVKVPIPPIGEPAQSEMSLAYNQNGTQ